MKRLALALTLCGLVINGTAAADQTCKAKAIRQNFAGEALISFVKKCETDAYMGLLGAGCGQKVSRTRKRPLHR
jgi:hypothetical protein